MRDVLGLSFTERPKQPLGINQVMASLTKPLALGEVASRSELCSKPIRFPHSNNELSTTMRTAAAPNELGFPPTDDLPESWAWRHVSRRLIEAFEALPNLLGEHSTR